MDLDLLLLPDVIKKEVVIEDDNWIDTLVELQSYFLQYEIYITGPLIFTREMIGLSTYKYTIFIPIDREISLESNSDLEYIPIFDVAPTVSQRCLSEDEFEETYNKIENFANENNISLKQQPYYHVMIDVLGDSIFDIYAEIEMD